MKINGITSTLQVHDLDQAINFYTLIGFELEWKWPESAPSHASIISTGHSFMLEKIDLDQQPSRADLYFRASNIETLHKGLLAKGIEASELQKADYGMLDFSITSPNGHHLTFGEPSGEWVE